MKPLGQFQKIVGVLDDGTLRDPTVRRNTAQFIALPHAASGTVELTAVTSGGAPAVLASCQLFVRKRLSASLREPPDLVVEGVPQVSPGLWHFRFTPESTRYLCAGRVFYDVWGQDDSGGSWQLVRVSGLHLHPRVGGPQ